MSLHKFRVPVVSSVLSLLILCYLYYYSSWKQDSSINLIPSDHSAVINTPVCPTSPLLDDTLLIMRTGATEILKKLPVHFNTTFRCFPNYVIYSDYEEEIEGHHVYDVLNDFSDQLRDQNPDFELYNRLRAGGRNGLNIETLFGSGSSGSMDHPGWRLDKWKFLPMVDRAFQHKPDAKWFVFIEADTYMLWKNTLDYLTHFDPTQPHYLGRHMYLRGTLFAYGGAGFVLSNPAASRVSEHWRANRARFDQLSQVEWAGDFILSQALREVGVDMFSAWPHLQGESLSTLEFSAVEKGRSPWCFVAATFHHMNSDESRALWGFEQQWLRQNRTADVPIRFRDVFRALIHPQLQPERDGWDNLSGERKYSDEDLAELLPDPPPPAPEGGNSTNPVPVAEAETPSPFLKCRTVCGNDPKCIQFSYIPGSCFTSSHLNLGHPVDAHCLEYSNAGAQCIKAGTMTESGYEITIPVRSGWIIDRVSRYMEKMDKTCATATGNDWVT